MSEHDGLIERLCRDARPVKRPAAPWVRTAGWMLAALACGFLVPLALRQGPADWSGAGALSAGCWLLASLLLAALAIKTAFTISIAGQRMRGGHWLAACAAAWLLAGLANATSTDSAGHLGDGVYCYIFMLGAGMPIMLVVVAALRRTRSLRPSASLAAAGLGIAAMAQTVLAFCHPVAGQAVDLAMHLAAGATLVAIAVLGGRRWVRV